MTFSQFETVRRIAADILDVPPDKITPESSPDTLDEWDSIRHLNIILALEGEFSVEFSTEEIEGANDMPSILALLVRKVGS